jgi:predicted dinucleotide-binding enzyme
LALPTHRFRELPGDLFAGKVLIDAMNYWEPIDGVDQELAGAPDGTSVVVQQHFPSARVVTSLNQLGYREFEEGRRPRGASGRVAIAAAGNDRAAVRAVVQLIDRLGFDAGSLEAGLALEPDGRAFGVTYRPRRRACGTPPERADGRSAASPVEPRWGGGLGNSQTRRRRRRVTLLDAIATQGFTQIV